MEKRNKFLIIANTIFGLMSVLVGTITTFAWFQINSQAPEANITTKDPNLTIDNSNVTGYKVVPTIGTDGFFDKTSNTVTSKKGETYDTSNNHQDVEDTSFDVPQDGLGYYLVKKNPSGTFKYTYNNTSYAKKFTEYTVSTVYNMFLENDSDNLLVCSVDDVFEIKQYSYDSANYKSVNSQVTNVTSENTGIATVDTYKNITIVTAGTYKVWYNSSSGKIMFETSFTASLMNRSSARFKKTTRTSSGSKTATRIYVEDQLNGKTGYGFNIFRLSGLSFSSGYSHTYFQSFLTSYMGVSCSSTSYTKQNGGTNIPNTNWWARNGTTYYYIRVVATTYGSYRGCYLELPEWVTAVSFVIVGNSWYNFAGGALDGYVWGDNNDGVSPYGLSSSWGIGKYVNYYIYNRSVWKYSATVGDAYTKNWGSATISKTGYCGSTSLGSVGSETVSKYYIFDTPSNPNSISGYSFTGNWYTNSSLSTALVTLFITGNVTIYAKYLKIWTMTLTPSYFVNVGTAESPIYERLNINCGQGTLNESIVNGNIFTTSQFFGNTSYLDTTNAIAYTFTRADSSWYTDAECTSSNYYGSTPKSNMTLYCKMVCAPLTTYYIDVSQTSWNGCNIHGWDNTKGVYIGGSPGSGSSFSCKPIIANNLYRVTLPTDLSGFVVHNGYSGGGSNQSNDVSISTTYNYLLLGNVDGSNRWAGWTSEKTTTSSNGVIQKYENSTWTTVATMDIGDGSTNDFIYEKGYQFNSGDIVRIYNTSTSRGYGYSDYLDSTKHPYVATGQSGAGITLTNFTGSARFNFYLTAAGKVSIAMVPDYGNGYYIIPYNTSVSSYTEHYIGAIKMDSNDYSAIYTGYYTAGGSSNRIFIKSYLSGVDTIATNLTTTTTSSIATISNGIITFTTSGRYTITVTNKTVDISPYEVDDFFTLNPVDTSSASTSAQIFAQKTTLIMEIPFVCNNPYTSAITLVTDCNVSYIGVNLYVSASSLGTGAEIYSTLRGASSPSMYYTGLTAANTSTPITNKNTSYTSVAANDSSTHYAYIIIDYRPGVTSENISVTAPEFKLYLQSNQP